MTSRMSHVSAFSATSSAMYQSTLEGSGIHRETFGDRMTQTMNWLYNPEEGTVMGRHPLDWGLLVIMYVVLLCALVGMSAVFCALFYWVIDWNYPTLQGASSMLQTPGMGFRPQPDVTSTLIRFVKGDGSTYVHYLDHIEAYIQYYENELQQGENFMDCRTIGERRTKQLDQVCVFDLNVLGDSCVKQQNYGFDDGQPCVLLKLNKVFNWVPEEYTGDTVHKDILDQWGDPWFIYVKCDGDDPATRENMGQLFYFPEQGFPFKYFPFRNQQGYRSPLVFLRFENPHPGILLMITCKAYARNIIHDRVDRVGQVSFEVMVD
ncbi:sodium/potassium-transporting ATPase subunit beta-2 [Aplysia californica]|uniref:Sodium/potassium-transporting ATPase subunit beta-2 n=1 Tax=Aplysia californica TaxID=6500 RepID=A0ABM0K841_APLCA|nr:sodium/potassium-transporting ATPase subunit beta-2 [Aplysia californica]